MYWPLSSEHLPFFTFCCSNTLRVFGVVRRWKKKAYWTNWQLIPKRRISSNKHTTQRRNIHLYQVKDEAENTSEDQWGGWNKRYLCTEQTKWWIWNSSGPVLLTWKIALWIICAWLNRLWSVKSTQTLRRPAQHYSLVITKIRGISWRALRVDNQDCLIMHRLQQKGGGGWIEMRMNWSCGGDQEDTGGAIPLQTHTLVSWMLIWDYTARRTQAFGSMTL